MSAKSQAVIIALFAVYGLACLFPILLVFVISISDESAIQQYGYSIFPASINFNSYKFILSDITAVMRSYGVSSSVTIIGTLAGTLITALYAYPLSRPDFRYKRFFSFFVAFTMLFNGGLVPWYVTYVRILGMKNTIWALIIPMLVNGFNVIILRTFCMNNVPFTLIESAKLDGAGEYQTFLKIVFPLLKPGLATVALFMSLAYWNDWYNALLFIDSKKMFPLQYLMYQVNNSLDVLNTSSFVSDTAKLGYVRPSESARMAMAIFGIGPIILAYPFLQKYFVKGLTIGAVKG